MKIAGVASLAAASLWHLPPLLPLAPTVAFSNPQPYSTQTGAIARGSSSDLAGGARREGRRRSHCASKLDPQKDVNGNVDAREDEERERKRVLAASILGFATIQLHVAKAFAAGALGIADVADVAVIQDERQTAIAVEGSSASSLIVDRQTAPLETAPSSQISASLPGNFLLADGVGTLEATDVPTADVVKPVEKKDAVVENFDALEKRDSPGSQPGSREEAMSDSRGQQESAGQSPAKTMEKVATAKLEEGSSSAIEQQATKLQRESAEMDNERQRLVAEQQKIQQDQERARMELAQKAERLEAQVRSLEEDFARARAEKERAEAEQGKLAKERDQLRDEKERIQQQEETVRFELGQRAEMLEAEIKKQLAEKDAAEVKARIAAARIARIEQSVLQLERGSEDARSRFQQLKELSKSEDEMKASKNAGAKAAAVENKLPRKSLDNKPNVVALAAGSAGALVAAAVALGAFKSTQESGEYDEPPPSPEENYGTTPDQAGFSSSNSQPGNTMKGQSSGMPQQSFGSPKSSFGSAPQKGFDKSPGMGGGAAFPSASSAAANPFNGSQGSGAVSGSASGMQSAQKGGPSSFGKASLKGPAEGSAMGGGRMSKDAPTGGFAGSKQPGTNSFGKTQSNSLDGSSDSSSRSGTSFGKGGVASFGKSSFGGPGPISSSASSQLPLKGSSMGGQPFGDNAMKSPFGKKQSGGQAFGQASKKDPTESKQPGMGAGLSTVMEKSFGKMKDSAKSTQSDGQTGFLSGLRPKSNGDEGPTKGSGTSSAIPKSFGSPMAQGGSSPAVKSSNTGSGFTLGAPSTQSKGSFGSPKSFGKASMKGPMDNAQPGGLGGGPGFAPGASSMQKGSSFGISTSFGTTSTKGSLGSTDKAQLGGQTAGFAAGLGSAPASGAPKTFGKFSNKGTQPSKSGVVGGGSGSIPGMSRQNTAAVSKSFGDSSMKGSNDSKQSAGAFGSSPSNQGSMKGPGLASGFSPSGTAQSGSPLKGGSSSVPTSFGKSPLKGSIDSKQTGGGIFGAQASFGNVSMKGGVTGSGPGSAAGAPPAPKQKFGGLGVGPSKGMPSVSKGGLSDSGTMFGKTPEKGSIGTKQPGTFSGGPGANSGFPSASSSTFGKASATKGPIGSKKQEFAGGGPGLSPGMSSAPKGGSFGFGKGSTENKQATGLGEGMQSAMKGNAFASSKSKGSMDKKQSMPFGGGPGLKTGSAGSPEAFGNTKGSIATKQPGGFGGGTMAPGMKGGSIRDKAPGGFGGGPGLSSPTKGAFGSAKGSEKQQKGVFGGGPWTSSGFESPGKSGSKTSQESQVSFGKGGSVPGMQSTQKGVSFGSLNAFGKTPMKGAMGSTDSKQTTGFGTGPGLGGPSSFGGPKSIGEGSAKSPFGASPTKGLGKMGPKSASDPKSFTASAPKAISPAIPKSFGKAPTKSSVESTQPGGGMGGPSSFGKGNAGLPFGGSPMKGSTDKKQPGAFGSGPGLKSPAKGDGFGSSNMFDKSPMKGSSNDAPSGLGGGPGLSPGIPQQKTAAMAMPKSFGGSATKGAPNNKQPGGGMGGPSSFGKGIAKSPFGATPAKGSAAGFGAGPGSASGMQTPAKGDGFGSPNMFDKSPMNGSSNNAPGGLGGGPGGLSPGMPQQKTAAMPKSFGGSAMKGAPNNKQPGGGMGGPSAFGRPNSIGKGNMGSMKGPGNMGPTKGFMKGKQPGGGMEGPTPFKDSSFGGSQMPSKGGMASSQTAFGQGPKGMGGMGSGSSFGSGMPPKGSSTSNSQFGGGPPGGSKSFGKAPLNGSPTGNQPGGAAVGSGSAKGSSFASQQPSQKSGGPSASGGQSGFGQEPMKGSDRMNAVSGYTTGTMPQGSSPPPPMQSQSAPTGGSFGSPQTFGGATSRQSPFRNTSTGQPDRVAGPDTSMNSFRNDRVSSGASSSWSSFSEGSTEEYGGMDEYDYSQPPQGNAFDGADSYESAEEYGGMDGYGYGYSQGSAIDGTDSYGRDGRDFRKNGPY